MNPHGLKYLSCADMILIQKQLCVVTLIGAGIHNNWRIVHNVVSHSVLCHNSGVLSKRLENIIETVLIAEADLLNCIKSLLLDGSDYRCGGTTAVKCIYESSNTCHDVLVGSVLGDLKVCKWGPCASL